MLVSVNFKPNTGSNEEYAVVTFTKIPNGKETVHNANGKSVVANTFLKNDNISIYTKAKFQVDVLDITRQKLPADLASAQFPLNSATLYVSQKDALFREIILEAELRFIENQFFITVCPGISYPPYSIINQVK